MGAPIGKESVGLAQPLGQIEKRREDPGVPHEIEGHVMAGLEQRADRHSSLPTIGCAHPAVAEEDTVERELLGHVVEAVPLVVGPLGRRLGHFGEREESQHEGTLPVG